VYDVAHNVAKIERHGGREVCVHRKGRRVPSRPAPKLDVPMLPGIEHRLAHPAVGLGNLIATVRMRRAPMMSASAGLRL
jgi:tRNA-splicing ligase RtcB (3'-phosphate/5'-hydroxy nucleic acid ligase)